MMVAPQRQQQQTLSPMHPKGTSQTLLRSATISRYGAMWSICNAAALFAPYQLIGILPA